MMMMMVMGVEEKEGKVIWSRLTMHLRLHWLYRYTHHHHHHHQQYPEKGNYKLKRERKGVKAPKLGEGIEQTDGLTSNCIHETPSNFWHGKCAKPSQARASQGQAKDKATEKKRREKQPRPKPGRKKKSNKSKHEKSNKSKAKQQQQPDQIASSLPPSSSSWLSAITFPTAIIFPGAIIFPRGKNRIWKKPVIYRHTFHNPSATAPIDGSRHPSSRDC